MKRLMALVGVGLISFSGHLLAKQAESIAENNSDLVGHYYLRGVMEMGSEIILREDGRFMAGVAFGSVNGFAQGTARLPVEAMPETAMPSTSRPTLAASARLRQRAATRTATS